MYVDTYAQVKEFQGMFELQSAHLWYFDFIVGW
jgi:hypothetical protein